MNMKQFRKPANMHSRTAIAGGRIVGGRGFRLMSKIGQNAISLHRLEQLLAEAQQRGTRSAP
jgi:hypothetical protein